MITCSARVIEQTRGYKPVRTIVKNLGLYKLTKGIHLSLIRLNIVGLQLNKLNVPETLLKFEIL